ncbi:MAG: hypothetical protein WA708_19015 [Acidobacteriaceae bacterium]
MKQIAIFFVDLPGNMQFYGWFSSVAIEGYRNFGDFQEGWSLDKQRSWPGHIWHHHRCYPEWPSAGDDSIVRTGTRMVEPVSVPSWERSSAGIDLCCESCTAYM